MTKKCLCPNLHEKPLTSNIVKPQPGMSENSAKVILSDVHPVKNLIQPKPIKLDIKLKIPELSRPQELPADVAIGKLDTIIRKIDDIPSKADNSNKDDSDSNKAVTRDTDVAIGEDVESPNNIVLTIDQRSRIIDLIKKDKTNSELYKTGSIISISYVTNHKAKVVFRAYRDSKLFPIIIDLEEPLDSPVSSSVV